MSDFLYGTLIGAYSSFYSGLVELYYRNPMYSTQWGEFMFEGAFIFLFTYFIHHLEYKVYRSVLYEKLQLNI